MTNTTIHKNENKIQSRIRWSLIIIFIAFLLISQYVSYNIINQLFPIVIALSLFIVSWMHGSERYGYGKMVVFFIIVWIVSCGFEALSIQTGFPFGHYYYDKFVGPRILEVPIAIMPAYFGMGYLSWTLAHVLTGQYSKTLRGLKVVTIPLIATFIMVMWDLVMDPVNATILSRWVWKEGGTYFNVPISNYFGWFFVVFIFFQIFAIFISKYDTRNGINSQNKMFWYEAAVLYSFQGILSYPSN